jgi:hypothetical protein
MHIDHHLAGARLGVRDVANREVAAARPIGNQGSPRHGRNVANRPAVRSRGNPAGCATLSDLQLGDLRFSDVRA